MKNLLVTAIVASICATITTFLLLTFYSARLQSTSNIKQENIFEEVYQNEFKPLEETEMVISPKAQEYLDLARQAKADIDPTVGIKYEDTLIVKKYLDLYEAELAKSLEP